MKIWLDDEFAPFKKRFLFSPGLPQPTDDWMWAKTTQEAFTLISTAVEITDFAVDNDLGPLSDQGIELLRMIREMVMNGTAPQFVNTEFYPITNNIAVAQEMRNIIEDIYNLTMEPRIREQYLNGN
jgi:hypothetical protein